MSMTAPWSLPGPFLEDLRKSGLKDETIQAMKIRPATPSDWANLALPAAVNRGAPPNGYVIPYFQLDGSILPDFYRIRLVPPLALKAKGGKETRIKYIQPAHSTNHVYIPPMYREVQEGRPFVIITEGEKKAAAACQFGFPAVGLGGVDSWRTRTFELIPAKISERRTALGSKLQVQIVRNSEIRQLEERVAPELLDLAQLWIDLGVTIYILFDTDRPQTSAAPAGEPLKEEVRRAAFDLALWLTDQGVSTDKIQLVILPSVVDNGKTGLDDFLVQSGPGALDNLLTQGRWGFPTHPNPKRWISMRLDTPLRRSDYLRLARAILADLDQHGERYRDPNGNYYYFDSRKKVLHAFSWSANDLRQFRLSTFGAHLYDRFGVGTADSSLLARLADLFTATPPLKQVTPRRVLFATHRDGEDRLYYQLSDNRMIKITADKITLCDNGHDGVLFLAGQVEPVNEERLKNALRALKAKLKAAKSTGEVPPEWRRWYHVLGQVNLTTVGGLSREKSRILLTLLFYLSPWLRRWRGMMLPIELMLGEATSGKSSLYNLRLGILTGRPSLSNPPADLRDWYASITSAPALWVCDNMGNIRKDLREAMSDELSRLTTDPEPAVEMRRLYTTAEKSRLPIDCCFAVTAIQNPFWKADLLQRSLVIQLEAIPAGRRDGQWYSRQLKNGGREEWLANHFLVIQRFFQLARKHWREEYLSGHRLVHFEQGLLLMGRALGWDVAHIVKELPRVVRTNIAENDVVMQALRQFAIEWLEKHGPDAFFTPSDVVSWVEMDVEERYSQVRVLRSPVSVGKYIHAHRYDVWEVAGIYEATTRRNQVLYKVDPKVLKRE